MISYEPATKIVHRTNRGVASSDLQILIAEDDAADAYLIRKVIEANPRVGGVAMASDGEQALELMRTGGLRPDLAIVDINMPRKNGLGLLLELGCGEWPRFPVAILTSSRANQDAIRARLRGAHYFFTKPDAFEDLEVILDEMIARV